MLFLLYILHSPQFLLHNLNCPITPSASPIDFCLNLLLLPFATANTQSSPYFLVSRLRQGCSWLSFTKTNLRDHQTGEMWSHLGSDTLSFSSQSYPKGERGDYYVIQNMTFPEEGDELCIIPSAGTVWQSSILRNVVDKMIDVCDAT